MSIYAEQKATRTAEETAGRTDNEIFCDAVERMILAMGRRVADGDIDGLEALARLRKAVDQATYRAVTRLRPPHGVHSWTDIGRELGITRQSAQERFGGR